MAKPMEIYKCKICGNIVEVLHGGMGTLTCCGQPMKLMEARSTDEGREKHLPVIEKAGAGVKVKVGSIPHPMEEKHFVEWIEVVTAAGVTRHHFQPGDAPEAVFKVADEVIEVREYCNLHGLWKTIP